MMRKQVTVQVVSAVLSSVLIYSVGTAVPAERPEDFYKGKTVAIYTGSAGGSADALSRVLARHLEKEMGVKAIVENQPGGSAMQMCNLFYKAKPDGLLILCQETSGVTLSDWFHDPGAVWQVSKFNWLALAAFQPGIGIVSPKSPYKTIKDLQQAKGLKLGASTPLGYYGISNSLVASLLNLDAKVITGLKGTSGIVLSVEKGELDGSTLADDAAIRFVKGNQVRPVFVISGESRLFPDLPVLTKLLKLTKDQELLVDAVATVNKCIATSPGVPQGRVDYLRRIVRKICEDKAVQKDIMDKTGIAGWYGFVPGEKVQKDMADPNIGPKVKSSLEAIFDKYMVR